LPEAERQFRETYLRRLLSESPSAKKAAERAGVPYTTLCSMMKKLGLSKCSWNA
jgi:transcriptional regulator of aromatic amino acid metabolism